MQIAGTVIHGEQRGRELGFRTANIALDHGCDLPYGVYAGRALGRPAAVSIGVRPTFGAGLEPLAEVHILDFDGDLYGRQLDVELLAFLRPEVRFESAHALVRQIEADVEQVRDEVGGRRFETPTRRT
jgi:riboflavin kinase/FMN adenylyltransferase